MASQGRTPSIFDFILKKDLFQLYSSLFHQSGYFILGLEFCRNAFKSDKEFALRLIMSFQINYSVQSVWRRKQNRVSFWSALIGQPCKLLKFILNISSMKLLQMLLEMILYSIKRPIKWNWTWLKEVLALTAHVQTWNIKTISYLERTLTWGDRKRWIKLMAAIIC